MNRSTARPFGTVLGMTAAAVGIAAVLVARVVQAERQALSARDLPHEPGDRTAIVVFGGQTGPTGPCEEVVSRLGHARALFERGLASVIVVSGGTTVDDEGRILDEPAAMAAWLIAQGVPAEAVRPGVPGDNTRQTVATMARMSREDGLHPWLAVSSPYHARRIRDEARRAGIDAVVSSPGDSPETHVPRVRGVRVLTEAVATAYYVLPESVTSRVRTSSGSWRHTIPVLLAGIRE